MKAWHFFPLGEFSFCEMQKEWVIGCRLPAQGYRHLHQPELEPLKPSLQLVTYHQMPDNIPESTKGLFPNHRWLQFVEKVARGPFTPLHIPPAGAWIVGPNQYYCTLFQSSQAYFCQILFKPSGWNLELWNCSLSIARVSREDHGNWMCLLNDITEFDTVRMNIIGDKVK